MTDGRHSEEPAGAAVPAALPLMDGAPDLVVVIPVLNEAENVPLVVARLNRALAGIA